ncbi:PP2C family protein-serine/threonine phosphatase [Ornatilinea apprima]|uniref:PP2C family protein-serine/threonine phosphatase n=1 Tax=Ornatilinea apprima TaxID=1134406 RepID=UPI0009E7B45B|nr:protein phosphatase 2C domain-containing protein [Ornatilinea apprima]
MFDFIKQLFTKKSSQSESDVQTTPLSNEQVKSLEKEVIAHTPPQLLVGSAQSVGRQRDHNEDTLFTLNAMFADGRDDVPFGVFIVADGMGGHQNGEVASAFAVRSMAEYLISRLYSPVLGMRSGTQIESLHEIIEEGVQEAQSAVVKNAPGGGTTLTTALVMGERVTIAHVGDSRAYFIHPDGRMRAVTKDHSLVRRLIELGQINEDEAAVHPQRNVLYRALGQQEPFRPEVNTHLLPHPGYLMICSDGLWGVLGDAEIFRIITKAPDPSEACLQLVDAANAAGGPDNISVILVQYLE